MLLNWMAAQGPMPAPAPQSVGEISGSVKSGAIPLPGVSISATNTVTGKKALTSTDVDGSFRLAAPGNGRYVVRAELPGFAPVTQEAVIDAANRSAKLTLKLLLASRVQVQVQRQEQAQGQARSAARAGGRGGFQSLGLNANPGGDLSGNASALGAENGSGLSGGTENPGNIPQAAPGMTADAPTESVAFSGNMGRSEGFGGNNEEMRQRIQEARQRGEGGTQGGGPGGRGGGDRGGFGGGGVGGGGFGGPGGGDVIFLGGGRGGRFNMNRPHGVLSYTLGDSALDAKPYSLSGTPIEKPEYVQHRFAALLGGPLKIPKIYDGGLKTFFFVAYSGSRAENPFDAFSTVPTLAERAGDFSATTIRSGRNAGLPVQIYDPQTQQPFADNTIPSFRIDPAAAALLKFIPAPNLPGEEQNFHRVTSVTNDLDNLNLRLIHNFSGATPSGGRGGRGGGRNNINFGFNFRQSNNRIANPFPSVAGNTKARGMDAPIGFVRSKGKFSNNFRFDFNRNRIATQNLYASSQDMASQLGIAGVSENPLDWGLPNLSFTNFAGIRDITPLLRRDQTISLSDTMIWTHEKHTFRWGGDFRRIQLNTFSNSNPRGTFLFTGLFTGSPGAGGPVPGTGLDLADFLLGLPQQTSIQFTGNGYYFRGNSWDLFGQDDWKLRGNLTLNVGLRYEYVSPYTEKNQRLVNLDAAPGFTTVAPVLPGQAGPFTGTFPITLVDPDRNNFAPRVGIAWKPLAKTVVRAGYGINYNTGAYASIVQQLAFQPPFSFTETNVASLSSPLSLERGFPTAATAGLTNNFGADRNYRLGYVQLWNVDVQQELSPTLILNAGYTGSKGTRLDMQRAPNRGSDGLRIPGVEAFLWESSEADSILHSGTVRLRQRMHNGLSLGGAYTFSHSIDNASTIGGGAVVVAQNDLDLAAERGRSSFDQRNKLTADYVFELPFGSNKRWLSGEGWRAKALGDWQISGDASLGSGLPFTARILGDFSDVSRGTNGTLRANATGQPVSLDHPTILEFFNTAAFAVPPRGTFGNAGRNTIGGPGQVNLNMALTKNIPLRESRALEIRAQANNIFNIPQFTSLNTVVNSIGFGQVVGVAAMRRIQFVTRFRF